MRRRWLTCIPTVTLLLAAGAIPASAHPMGNFTINHYAAIEVQTEGLAINYVLDMAEVPTFQELAQLDEEGIMRHLTGRLAEWVRGLQVTADGVPVPLALTAAKASCLPGAGGLPTLRIDSDVWAGFGAIHASSLGRRAVHFIYHDANFPDRVGWKEIVVAGRDVRASTAPRTDSGTNRLRTYPADFLKTPPSDVKARFAARLAHQPREIATTSRQPSSSVTFDLSACHLVNEAATGTIEGSPRSPRFQSTETTAFGALFKRLSEGQLTLRIVLVALLGAFVLGAYHAFTPGHGKTILAAYLIGSHGTPGQAVLLGTTVTLTHTMGVFLLGVGTLFASRYVLPEKLYPWLGVLSGLMLFGMGVSLLRRRLSGLRSGHVGIRRSEPGQGSHPHELGHVHNHLHLHDHDHRHGHHHPVPWESIRARDLITLGITGGLLPCPSALVVMLAAISVRQVTFGLVLITSFSLGLAVVLTAGGMLMVYGRAFISGLVRRALDVRHPSWWRLLVGPGLQRLPVLSAVAVAVLGLAIAMQTLASTGLVR